LKIIYIYKVKGRKSSQTEHVERKKRIRYIILQTSSRRLGVYRLKRWVKVLYLIPLYVT
jgi:hypothetical protein